MLLWPEDSTATIDDDDRKKTKETNKIDCLLNPEHKMKHLERYIVVPHMVIEEKWAELSWQCQRGQREREIEKEIGR